MSAANDLEVFKKSNQVIGKDSLKVAKANKCVNFVASRPKWIWAFVMTTLVCICMGSIATILVTLLYNPQPTVLPEYPLNSTAGKPCKQASDCISNAYCLIPSGKSIGICNCATTYYFDSTNSSCVQRKNYSQPCSFSYECLEYKRMSCISGSCICDATKFWNSTAYECQYYKVPFGICSSTGSNTECVANSVCWPNPGNMGANKCICGWVWNYNWWWYNTKTGTCDNTKLAGSECSVDYECSPFSYCDYTVSSPNKKVCVCDTNYYQHPNGQCYVKQGYWTGCSLIDQCNLNQYNLRCISGICRCDLTAEYWDSFYLQCLPLKTYGQTCSSNTDCISTFTCAFPSAGGTRKACLCSSTQYFDWASGTCQTTKSYNSICYSRNECSNTDSMVCLASNGGVTKRCLCAPNYAYLSSSSTCILKKSSSSSCTTDIECQDYLGFICTSGTCQCQTGTTYNTAANKCIPKKRRASLCYSNSECASNCCGSACNSWWNTLPNICQ